MSALMADELSGSASASRPWAQLPPTVLAGLAGDLEQAILVRVDGVRRRDALLGRAIEDAIAAFIEYAGHPAAAAEQVAVVMAELGARESALDRELDERFVPALELVRGAARAYAPRLLVRSAGGGRAVALLLEELDVFLDLIGDHARQGFVRRLGVTGLSQDEARDRLRSVLFRKGGARPDARELDALAAAALLRADATFAPVIRLGSTLLGAAVGHADVLLGLDPREALVPAQATDALCQALGLPSSVLIVGPALPLTEFRRSLLLTRRAAHLISQGSITARPVMHTRDLLGDIVLHGDSFTAQLLVEKHCGPLLALGPRRRLPLAEFLLRWLESGKQVPQLAQELGCPEQTLYHRLKRLRQLFGDVLDDDHQRLELVIALRHALPKWRREVAAHT